ncbi:MAG: dephospho-CoA kinase [Bacteroidota bacterium]|nr:dephospho-CoA kinase [Bacteroidota bacterium]
MLKIGLTGGIGSGKTTVAQIFEVLAIPVYYADQEAKDLMNQDPELKKKIISEFGEAAYREGKIDRSYLGGLVFTDAEKLAVLNSIVHPATLKQADSWMKNQTAPYAIKEAALIFEAGLEKFFDYIIGVTAPDSLRLERVIKRDQTSAENVRRRMEKQMNEDEKMKRCDFVIQNDGMRAVLPQVLEIHKNLLIGINKMKK